MSTTNDGGPAFPYREQDGAGGFVQHPGMSLRDWFAGQALAKLSHPDAGVTATQAYHIADSMLAARDRKECE